MLIKCNMLFNGADENKDGGFTNMIRVLGMSKVDSQQDKEKNELIRLLEEYGVKIPEDDKARNVMILTLLSNMEVIDGYENADTVSKSIKEEGFNYMVLSKTFNTDGVIGEHLNIQILDKNRYESTDMLLESMMTDYFTGDEFIKSDRIIFAKDLKTRKTIIAIKKQEN